MVGQGNIIQRASKFVEYAAIYTIRPITNEQYAAALKALDLKKTGTSPEGNTKAVKFSCSYFSASIRCVEQTEINSVYRFEFDSWKKYGRASFENEKNMLLTMAEKCLSSFLRIYWGGVLTKRQTQWLTNLRKEVKKYALVR